MCISIIYLSSCVSIQLILDKEVDASVFLGVVFLHNGGT